MKAFTLGYHDILETGLSHAPDMRDCSSAYAVSRLHFRKHLSAIAEALGSTPVVAVKANYEWKQEQVLFSFDDGEVGAWKCAAPELESFGWRGHFFITTDWVGRPGFLNRAQIVDLYRRGHVIGSHTCSHPSRMSLLGRQELLREWRNSVEYLSELLGERVTTASVAHGYYVPKVAEAAAACGIKTLFNSEPVCSLNQVQSCRVLGRYAVHSTTSPAEVAGLAAGNVLPRLRQFAWWEIKKGVKNMAGEKYLAVRKHLLANKSESGSL